MCVRGCLSRRASSPRGSMGWLSTRWVRGEGGGLRETGEMGSSLPPFALCRWTISRTPSMCRSTPSLPPLLAPKSSKCSRESGPFGSPCHCARAMRRQAEHNACVGGGKGPCHTANVYDPRHLPPGRHMHESWPAVVSPGLWTASDAEGGAAFSHTKGPESRLYSPPP